MTILAGAITTKPGSQLPSRLRAQLRRAISRHPSDTPTEIGNDAVYLAHVDIGAFNAPGIVTDELGCTTMIAGDPIFSTDATGQSASRFDDVRRLHASWSASEWSVTETVRSTYCAVHYDALSNVLSLIADKLGVRPIYYWAGPRFAVYASALRIIEALDDVPRELDPVGVTEASCLGYPLGNRTAYRGIATIDAGEIVHISARGVNRRKYWHWDRLPAADPSHADFSRMVHEKFVEAIKVRLRGDRTVVAFLSGGLDSRCIVGALSKIGTQVHTVNFAPAGTQDLIFGRAIAERLGTAHTEVALGEDTAENKRSLAIAACLDSARARAAPPERSRLVWAGDGGSVGLGHVYLSSGPISLIREGHLEQAVDAFQKHHNVSLPRFILNRDAADTLSGILKQSILAEVSAFSGSDPGRALHLFLMQNDQRRHLAQHFENIDLDRVEMHLPFFDAEFLAPVLASPVDHFLRHRFYNEWLAHFPDPISQVPWQAYPGHEPCPLTVNEILRYQWTDYYDAQSKKKIVSKVLENATVMLRSDTFPHVFVSKVRLRLAALLMRLGIRDTRISVLVAYSYFCYWIKCNSTTDSRTVSQVQQ